jgi:hypothetical protein
MRMVVHSFCRLEACVSFQGEAFAALRDYISHQARHAPAAPMVASAQIA